MASEDREENEFYIEEPWDKEEQGEPIKVPFNRIFVEPPCSLKELFEEIGAPQN